MKLSNYLTFILIVSVNIIINAQWSEVSSFNGPIDDLIVFNSELHIAGEFTKREDETCYRSCYLSQNIFNNQTTLIGGGGINNLEIFQNELYGAGSLIFGNSIGVSKWTGSSWINAGSFNVSHSGIFADGDDLYVGSDFGEISRKTLDGNFISLPSLDEANDNILDIIKYDDKIVIVGSLETFNSVDINNIAQWNGNSWEPIGDGLSSKVRCAAIFNSELYVGGNFSTAGGIDANYIAKWNGSTWSDVGGSVTIDNGNGIRDMIVHDNRLYVVGDFTQIGGVDSKYVASWDGQSWSSLSLDIGSDFVNCIEYYDGRIYIGTFDFNDAKLYSNDLNTSIRTIKNNEDLVTIGPNPVDNILEIEFEKLNFIPLLKIFNNQGNLLYSKKVINSSEIINTEHLVKGAYILSVANSMTGEIFKIEKIIKL